MKKGKRILLVDDDIFLGQSISLYLISKNFSVFLANTVTAALNELNKETPDLIIADIMMPDLDGYNFLQIIRSNSLLYKIPVVLLTAKGMTSDRIKGYNAGCNVYVTKPFDPNELLAIINNLLKSKSLIEQVIDIKTVLSNSLPFVKIFTSKEIDVLKLVMKGFRNKEIANSLNISIRSVEKHVSRLLNKTSTRNRTELTQFINSAILELHEGE
uniref:Conserved hypothetical plastid protein n=1 Tax=Caulacanthus okamurae TaxID=152008 RepID=A0A6H1U6Y9_9FLOR|nr:conserved hypothetical plastid protein [Caulacanthus okamurae]QIZ74614.1 conserved hypothetical plastid protein [Caulacanthus okamurae]